MDPAGTGRAVRVEEIPPGAHILLGPPRFHQHPVAGHEAAVVPEAVEYAVDLPQAGVHHAVVDVIPVAVLPQPADVAPAVFVEIVPVIASVVIELLKPARDHDPLRIEAIGAIVHEIADADGGVASAVEVPAVGLPPPALIASAVGAVPPVKGRTVVSLPALDPAGLHDAVFVQEVALVHTVSVRIQPGLTGEHQPIADEEAAAVLYQNAVVGRSVGLIVIPAVVLLVIHPAGPARRQGANGQSSADQEHQQDQTQ